LISSKFYHINQHQKDEKNNGIEEKCNYLFCSLTADAEGKPISPFHDIPLYSNPETKECNMVVEIPRWTNHKMEVNHS